MAKVIGIDLGTTNSVVAVVEGGDPDRHPQSGRKPADPLRGGVHEGGRDPRRAGGQAAGDHQPRQHRLLDQALHGAPVRRGAAGDQAGPLQGRQGAERRRARRGAGQGVLAPGDLRADPAQAQGGRRGVSRGEGDPGGHHRSRLLQRQPAPGHQGGGHHRRPGGAPDRQRAHRGRARLRPRQEEGRDHRGLRPRRRHLRHLHPGDRRGRGRGEGDQWRHPPRRRRLRPAGHRLDRRRVQARERDRPPQGPHGAAAAEGGRGEGQVRAVHHRPDGDQPPVHHRGRHRTQAPGPHLSRGPSSRPWWRN